MAVEKVKRPVGSKSSEIRESRIVNYLSALNKQKKQQHYEEKERQGHNILESS